MEKKVFRKGDYVTAELMTEMCNTVAEAEKNAAAAKSDASQAKEKSEQAQVKAIDAYNKAVAAEQKVTKGKDGNGIYVSSQAFGTGVERYDMSSVSYNKDELTPGDLVISAQNYNVVAVRSVTSDGFNFIGEYKFNIKGPAPDLSNYVDKQTAQTITALKTFSAGAKIGSSWTVSENSSNELVFTRTGS